MTQSQLCRKMGKGGVNIKGDPDIAHMRYYPGPLKVKYVPLGMGFGITLNIPC